jgi:hypothetical protein
MTMCIICLYICAHWMTTILYNCLSIDCIWVNHYDMFVRLRNCLLTLLMCKCVDISPAVPTCDLTVSNIRLAPNCSGHPGDMCRYTCHAVAVRESGELICLTGGIWHPNVATLCNGIGMYDHSHVVLIDCVPHII